MPPEKKKGELTIQSNVYAFSIDQTKKLKELRELKLQKYSKDHNEPDWEEKRKEIEKKYQDALNKYSQKKLEERTQEIIDSAKSQKKDRLDTLERNKKADLKKIPQDAARFFPMPEIVLSFNGNNEASFEFGETDEETKEKIDNLAEQSLKEKQSDEFFINGPRDAGKITSTIIFSKVDKAAIKGIKEDTKTLFGKPRTRSPQFIAMKESIVSFDNDFNGENQNLGDISAEEKLKKFRDSLKAIKRNSEEYLSSHPGFRWTPSGRMRQEMARNAYAMATSKLQALEKAAKRTASVAENVTQRRNNYEVDAEDKIERDYKASVKNATDRIDSDTGKAIENAGTLYAKKITDAEKKQKDALGKLEKDRLSFQKKKLNAGIEITGSSFSVKMSEDYDDLTADQQFYINSAKLSRMLFEEKHNPFIGYKDQVPVGSNPGEIARNNANDNAVALDSLKTTLGAKNPPVPITYNADALLTLSNLQLYDKMCGVDRKQNAYDVTYEIVKGKDGDICFVTGIKAEPLKAENGYMAPAGNFDLTERSMIPKETAARIADMDKAYVQSAFNNSVDKTGVNPCRIIGKSFERLQDQITSRKSRDMLTDDPKSWSKFNIVSKKKLTRDIATSNVDFRPTKPGKKLLKKTFHKTGMVQTAAQYFDEDLMKNLSLNVSSDVSVKTDFSDAFKEKLLSEKSLTLPDKSFMGNDFQQLMMGKTGDEALEKIKDQVNKVLSMGIKDVLHYEKNYITKEGVSKVEPKTEPEEYIESESCTNDYDLEASKLHAQIKEYEEAHKGDLSNPQSPVSILKNWRKKAFPHNNSAYDLKDKNAIVIDATESRETDDPKVFDGDADYLIGAEITCSGEDFWTYEEDSPIAQQHKAEDKVFFMKECQNEPLFTREPSIGDMKQGNLGNCYFLSYLSSMTEHDPNAIKDMIHDNDDGTVTCKFFNEQQQPVFVKMNKTVPYVKSESGAEGLHEIPVSGEKAPLWFHLLQKGYLLAGMRPYNDLDAKDKESCRDKFADALGTDKKEKDIVDKLLEKRFDGADEKEMAIVNKNRGKIAERILNHSFASMEGGFTKNVHKHLTGETVREINMEVPDSKTTVSRLSNLSKANNTFCGDALKNMDDEDFTVVSHLCHDAALKLTAEKTNYSVDLKGQEFVAVENINMDDICEAMKQAAEKPSYPRLKKVDKATREKLCGEFIKAFTDHQMNKTETKDFYISQKTGKYSAVANRTFDAIRRHVKKNDAITCSFNSGSERMSDGKDLNLSGASESVSEKGVLSKHEFSILDCRVEGNKKIVVVRNPWGIDAMETRKSHVTSEKDNPDIDYRTLNLDDNQNEKDSGTFEMELNEFMEHANDITFLTNKPPLVKSDVVDNLSTQYLDLYKRKNPEQFKALVDKVSYGKVLEQTKKSETINQYANKVMKAVDILNKIEDGQVLPEDELNSLDAIKGELTKTFMPDKEKTADLSKEKQAVKSEEKQKSKEKGGAVIS